MHTHMVYISSITKHSFTSLNAPCVHMGSPRQQLSRENWLPFLGGQTLQYSSHSGTPSEWVSFGS